MRISYWDNWKGIAIIAVVAIHASNGTAAFEEGSFNWLFGLTFRQFIDFAVPLFLAMSGYFSVKNSSGNPISYYKGKFNRILIPYLIWTAIYLILKTPTSAPSTYEVLEGVFMGTGIGIGYFVIVLLQFVILTPLFARIESKSHHLAIMAIMSVVGSVFVYYFSAFNRDHAISEFPMYALPFFVWYPFYHAGYFLARFKGEIDITNRFKTLTLIGLIAFISLSILEGLFWGYNGNYSFGASQLKATCLAASLCLFLAAISFENKKTILDRRSPLTWLGVNSYAIYLTHMLFLTVIQKLMKRWEILYSLQPIAILLSAVFAILLCAALIKASQKILPNNFSRNLLGS